MWIYNQQTGRLLSPDGSYAGTGYSGHGQGVNNPADQQVKDVGPLPAGEWYISDAGHYEKLGPCTMPLTPCSGTETFGRTGFYIHGDDVNHPGEELASRGCLVFPLAVRQLINESKDKVLKVVS